ncbi:MAG: divalent metal cation transporter [Ktedonobacterales bacterium]
MKVESAEATHTTLRSWVARRLQRPRGHPQPLGQVGRWLGIIGPGLITGAADDDPSGIGTYSQAGAAYGVINIQTADQAAAALRPLAGPFAEALFALGIIGTGLLAIPVLAGSAAYGVAEAFGWREGLGQEAGNARGFYGVIALATLVGMLLNIVGINPITALVYTAIVNGVVAVPLLVLILLVANNPGIMGAYTNGRLSNTIGILTTAFMGVAAIVTVVSLFG